jgi:hypothetical protein
MALIYRAIWNEERADLAAAASLTFLDWLAYKGLRLDTLPGGTTEGSFKDARFGTEAKFELSARTAEAEGIRGLRIRLDERRVEEGRHWTTTLTVLSQREPGGMLWVDVDRFSDDPFERVGFRAPKLVKSLITEGLDPRIGHIRLESRPVTITAEPLAGLIRNAKRRIPLIVFSHDREGPTVTLERANAAFDTLAGVAQVYVLPPMEVDSFKEHIGEDLAVWGGAARLYLPNSGPAGLRPERHRYVSGAQAARHRNAAAEVFAAMLAAAVPATPPPASYSPVRRLLAGVVDGDLVQLLAVAEREAAALTGEVQNLREQLVSRDDQIIDSLAEIEELSGENNCLAAELQSLRLSRSSQKERHVSELPATVPTIAEAIEKASLLEHIALHPTAPVDIDKLDRAVNGPAWANQIWRGLRALDAYAESGGTGGFWNWCKGGGAAWSWPASAKKLAMKESEGVLANPDLRGARRLPVDSAVDPSERVEMFAHLKIAEGGGPLAPRIYFYDDTAGSTRKVHVGFVGPHEHMPNLGTN